MKVDLTVIKAALGSLDDALDPPPRNDRERDGAIQRFEYTFELAWKVGKRVLEELGIASQSPRSVIRDLAQQGLIDDAEAWLGYLTARNRTSHIYKKSVAEEVFAVTGPFANACQELVLRLETL